MNVGYHIKKDFKRVDKSVVDSFSGIPVPNIGDAMNRTASISSELRPINHARLQGTAYTVRVPAGDNLLIYYAIDNAKIGDVVVVDGSGFTERALIGGIMASLAKAKGLSGLVINGAVRDPRDLESMDFPVFYKAICPNGPYKNGPGEINVPVCVGGQIIHPGDLIVGNKEGIIVIPRLEIDDVLKKSLLIVQKEEKMMKDIEENQFDLSWVYKKLEETNCEIKENYLNER